MQQLRTGAGSRAPAPTQPSRVCTLAAAQQSVDRRHLVPVVGRQSPPRLRLWEPHVADPFHHVLVAVGVADLEIIDRELFLFITLIMIAAAKQSITQR